MKTTNIENEDFVSKDLDRATSLNHPVSLVSLDFGFVDAKLFISFDLFPLI